MFDVGFQELLLIMVLALIVFGPSKLPELGKMIGRAMREFKRASDEFRSTVETNLNLNEVNSEPTSPTPEPDPARGSVASVTPSAAAGPVPGVEAAPEDSESFAEAGAVATERAVSRDPFWAQRGSRLFHSRDCVWAARIVQHERVPFESVAEAKGQGFVACPVCEPWEVFAP